jgi:hypothetical protein
VADSILVGENLVAGKVHAIHMAMGRLFEKSLPTGCVLIRDEACGGEQRIPLFCTLEKSRATELCNVDMLVLKENRIRIIVEIEESNVKPTQICGKLLTAALDKYFIHESENDEPIRMDETVTFVQIVDTSRLVKSKTAKYSQWNALQGLIDGVLPLKGSNIKRYSLFYWDEMDSKTDERDRIVSLIQQACR